jgi:hypothetical protein
LKPKILLVYTVFLNKKCAETFFLLSRAEQLLFFGSCTVQIPCALHEPANCNTMSRIQQAGTTGCSLALSIFSSLLPTSHLATFDIFLSRLRSHVKRSPPPSASSSFAVFYHLRYASLLPSRIRFHSNAAAAPHTSRSLPPAPSSTPLLAAFLLSPCPSREAKAGSFTDLFLVLSLSSPAAALRGWRRRGNRGSSGRSRRRWCGVSRRLGRGANPPPPPRGACRRPGC